VKVDLASTASPVPHSTKKETRTPTTFQRICELKVTIPISKPTKTWTLFGRRTQNGVAGEETSS